MFTTVASQQEFLDTIPGFIWYIYHVGHFCPHVLIDFLNIYMNPIHCDSDHDKLIVSGSGSCIKVLSTTSKWK